MLIPKLVDTKKNDRLPMNHYSRNLLILMMSLGTVRIDRVLLYTNIDLQSHSTFYTKQVLIIRLHN